MPKNKILLYNGKTSARKISSIVRDGFDFDIVNPGVDIQGRNRITWTQFVWKGTPIWETKMECDLSTAVEIFNTEWSDVFAGKIDLARRMLELESTHRNERFQDGTSGNEVAASHEDGPVEKSYPG